MHLACEHAALDGSSYGHHFIRVDTFGRSLPKELLHNLLDCRNTCGTADENHLVNIGGGESGIREGFAAGLQCGLDQMVGQLFEL